MLGIVIPAHNEEVCLPSCLAALAHAAAHPALAGEEVLIHIVLDDCDDGSEAVIKECQSSLPAGAGRLSYSSIALRKVGAARASGAQLLLDQGVRWLAFTDADTRVSPEWLVQQLALNVDVVCGSVAVDDWSPHAGQAAMLATHFSQTYNDNDGHHHIHGANMGVAADAYRKAGGFQPVPCHEDVYLVAALERIGARFAWSAAPRVITSARTDARARGGFGDTMLAVVAASAAAGVTAER
ncbi:MAG: glycosyltransferase [Pseudomonadota bacterium]|nr:glycosyltransferase [Pseudomonadota bacterium]